MRDRHPGFVAVVLTALAVPGADATRVRLVHPSGEPVATAAAPDGWHDVSDDPAGRCLVGDHAPVVVPPGVAEGASITVRPAGIVEARTRLPDGRPARGVRLRVELPAELATCDVSATSDREGAVVLRGVPLGRRDVRVEAPDGLLAIEDVVEVLVRAERPARLEIVLHEASRVPVTVTGPAGPIAGAAVSILPDWRRFPLDPELGAAQRKVIEDAQVRTDALGAALLPALPRRAGWRIVARAAGLAAGSTTVDLRASAPPPARIALEPGGSISLRAVDSEGRPLDGARIRLQSLDAKDADLVMPPPAGGSDGVVLAGLLPKGRWIVELTARGARPTALHGVLVRAGETTALGDVTLEPGASVRGVVLADGEPIAGAMVTLDTFADGARSRLEAVTDSAGEIVFEGLDPMVRCDVRAAAEGFADASLRDVEPGSSIVLELQRLASLLLEVSDESGQPMSDVEVSLGRSRDDLSSVEVEPVPDMSGSFRAGGRSPGSVVVAVRAPGHARSIRDDVELVAGEETRVEIKLKRGRTLRGRVVDADTSQAVADATIAAQGAQASSLGDGTFVLEDLRSPVDVEVSHEDRPSIRLAAVDLDAVGSDGVEVRMAAGGAVEGLVLGPDGAPLAGALVEAPPRESVADVDGRYRLSGLAAGPCQLKKTNRRGTFDGLELARVEVVKGGITRHDFGRGGRMTGLVTHGGRPARGARLTMVEIVPEGGGSRDAMSAAQACATTDAEGRYVMTGVVAGEHGLTVTWEGRKFGRTVSIAPGAVESRVDVEIPDLHLAGRVVEAGTGEPVEGAWVTLECGAPSGSQWNSMMSFTDPDGFEEMLELATSPRSTDQARVDGAFHLIVNPPTACRLWAHAEGYEHWFTDQPFDVPASRDDVLVEMKRKEAKGRLRVTLRDALTGEPVPGTLLAMTSSRDGPQSGGTSSCCQATYVNDFAAADRMLTVVGVVQGRAPAIRRDVRAPEDGSDLELDLPLAPGGTLRLLVSGGMLAADAHEGFRGELALVTADGFDLAGRPFRAVVIGRAVREIESGTWLIEHLPPGRLGVSLAGGARRDVEIVPGETVELDLR